MPSGSADPRGAVVAVAILTARQAGVPVNVAALLDGLNPLALIGAIFDVSQAVLDESGQGEAILATIGLRAALRVQLGAGDDA